MADYILEVTGAGDSIDLGVSDDTPVVVTTPCNQNLPGVPLEKGVTIAGRNSFTSADDGKVLLNVIVAIVVTKITIILTESFFDDAGATMTVYSGATPLVSSEDILLQSNYEMEFEADIELQPTCSINLGVITSGIRGRGSVTIEYYKI